MDNPTPDKTVDIVDLGSLDTAARCDNGAEMELLHPATDAPLGAVITLAGVDSRIYRETLSALAEKRVQRRRTSLDDMKNEDAELAAKCTLAWQNIVLDGENLPCNLKNAMMLYTRFSWAREQALAFINSRANFLRD